MARGKKGKFNNRNRNLQKKPLKKKQKQTQQVVNKKALFNRYKNKQKVVEENLKKEQLERKLRHEQMTFSESEEETDSYDLLVSSFNPPKNQKVAVESDESDTDNGGGSQKSGDEVMQSNSEEYDSQDSDNIHNDPDLEINTKIRPAQEEENEDHEFLNDPFTRHLHYELGEALLVPLSNPSSETLELVNKTWPTLGKLLISIPKPVKIMTKVQPKVSLIEEKSTASPGTVPQIASTNFREMFIKSQIHGNIVSANKTNLIKKDLELTDILTPLQRELFGIMNNYQDLYYPERSFTNAEEIRFTYCLHVVNHIMKTRTKIIHHNAKLNRKTDPSEEFRDQGLVRPKVLILVPFKSAAYKVVKTLIDILVPKEAGQVLNKNRFEEDFTGGELTMPQKNPKPEDYELLFSGNTEDTFRIAMSVTKKTLKLYTDFYSSDIIVASPLGLRMIVGAEGEEDRDYDFLASIEVLVLDQTDVFFMQNWEHLLHCLDHFHLQPQKTRDTDFSRVRSWAINGWSKYYRQTMIFSSVALPEIKSILNHKCQNYAGKVLVTNPTAVGTIQQVLLQVPQIFHRFNASSLLAAVDARFEYFVKEVLPKQRDPLMSHTLIYVPSYFDYVRIRNYFKKEDISFVQICEYSKDGKIARARDMFFHTEAHFLLYSERVHFFRRFRVKGIRHIIFYQPPTYPHFYSEMCNLMQESNQNKYGGSEFNMSVTTLLCRYDAERAAAVAGVSRLAAILRADKPVHMYVTGG